MPPENRSSAEEPFRDLDEQLAALRAAAKSLREERPSRADNLLHPGRRARREADFGAAIVSALREIGTSVRKSLAEQNSQFVEIARHLSELDRRSEELAKFQRELTQLREQQERQEQQERSAREHAEAIWKEAEAVATHRTAELRQQIEQVRRDQEAKIEQLAAGQKDFANEFRERIQNLIDEGRVSVRQLALKVSEDAILSDRARRAIELKLEELVKRLPPAPPA
jgi:hypothetical protein